MWLVEVEDKQGKSVAKKIFTNEQEAKTYFKKMVSDTDLTVRLYS